MQLLDNGERRAWAQTFTEDGVFAKNVKPQPWKGRQEIGDRMTAGLARVAERQLTRRHRFGMVAACPGDGGSVRTRYYAIEHQTAKDGEARLHLSCVCEDVLIRQDDRWLVEYRRVAHDGA